MPDVDPTNIPSPEVTKLHPSPEEFRDWATNDLSLLTKDGGQYQKMPEVWTPDSGTSGVWRDTLLAVADAAGETADFSWQQRAVEELSLEEYRALREEALSLYGRGVSWALLYSVGIKHTQRREAGQSIDFGLTLDIRVRDFEDDIRRQGAQSHSSAMHLKYMGQHLDEIDSALGEHRFTDANTMGKSLVRLATKKFHSMSERYALPPTGLTD